MKSLTVRYSQRDRVIPCHGVCVLHHDSRPHGAVAEVPIVGHDRAVWVARSRGIEGHGRTRLGLGGTEVEGSDRRHRNHHLLSQQCPGTFLAPWIEHQVICHTGQQRYFRGIHDCGLVSSKPDFRAEYHDHVRGDFYSNP